MARNNTPYHRLLATSRWRELRAWQLGRAPFCEDCLKSGIYTEAIDVHHVVPVNTEVSKELMEMLAYDRGNLVSLCRKCHIQRHKEMKSHDREKKAERTRKEAEDFWRRIG